MVKNLRMAFFYSTLPHLAKESFCISPVTGVFMSGL